MNLSGFSRERRARRGVAGILAAVILFAAVFVTGTGFFLFVNANASLANKADASRASLGIQAAQEKLLVTAGKGSSQCPGCLWAMANNTGGISVTIIDAYVVCVSSCGTYQAGQLISDSQISSGSHFLQSPPDLNVSFPLNLGVGATTANRDNIMINESSCLSCTLTGEYVVINLVTQRGNVFSAQYPPPPLPDYTDVTQENYTNNVVLDLLGGGPELSVLLSASPPQTFSCAGCITLTATIYNLATSAATGVSLSLHTPYSDFVSGTASVSAYSACTPASINISAGSSGTITCQFSASTGHVGGLAAFSGHVSGTINGVAATSAEAISNSVEIGGLASATTQGAFASNFYFLKYSSCTQDTGGNFAGTCVPNTQPWPPSSVNSLPSGSYLAGGSNFYVAFYMQITNVFNTTISIMQYSYTFGDPTVSGEVYYFLAGNAHNMVNGVYYPNYSGTPSLIGYPTNCNTSPAPSGCISVAPGQSVYLTFAACGYGATNWAWGGQQDARSFDSSRGCTGYPPALTVPEGMVLGIVISFYYNGNIYSQMMPFEGQSYLRSSATGVRCVPSSMTAGTSTTCTATVTDTDGGGFSQSPTGTVTFSSQPAGMGTFTPTSCTLSSGTCSVTFTPSPGSLGPANINASYGGNYYFMTSEGGTNITVLRSTSTAMSCTPTTLPVGTATQCTATVTDTSSSPMTPTGTVSFAATPGTSGTFSPTTCTLSGSGSTATCTAQFTPSSGSEGPITVTGSYGGDSLHGASSGAAAVTATTRTSTLSISCSPSTVPKSAATQCTATVSDSSAGTKITPTGTVTFSASPTGEGSFSSTTCTLSSGSCSVLFTPSVSSGSITISASYGGDQDHTGSSGSTPITATTAGSRPTSTTVSCSPTSVPVNTPTTCTVTVKDTGSNPVVTPTGIVTFSATPSSSGSFQSSFCTLSGGSGTATCQVTFTPSPGSEGSIAIKATYGGDTSHAASSGTQTITSVKRSVSVSVTCRFSYYSNSCTATVTDNQGTGTAITPTGTVSFTINGNGIGSCTLSGSNGTASCTLNFGGSYYYGTTATATYGGDTDHTGGSAIS